MQRIKVADLDKGFEESGELIDGMVYGKNYQISLLGASPGQRVRWSCRFANKAGYDENFLADEGYAISFKVPDAQRCGCTLEVTAHGEGGPLCQLSVWVHYGFRFFKRPVLERELEERRINPWKIDQRSTALCGVACIFYLLATDKPDQYQDSIRELHRVGYVLVNSYKIRPPAILYEMNPETGMDYPTGMSYADWISLASVRSMESRLGYRGRKKEVFSAINWPPMLMRLGRTLLDYTRVKFRLFSPLKTYLNDLLFPYKKVDILLNRIQRSHDAGAKIVLMIDLDMLYSRANYSLGALVRYHWIVYEGGLRMEDREGASTMNPRKAAMIYFKCYTWGQPVDHSHTMKGISRNAFIRNFYGYIEMVSAANV